MSNKIALITDTHFGNKSDADWMLDNQEKFFTEVFFPTLLSLGIKVILHLGDLFDRRKYINFVTLKRTRDMFLSKLQEYNIEMFIIPGNHDVAFKSTNTVNSLTTLLGEFADNVTIIEKPTEFNLGGVRFAMIPWINPENEDSILQFCRNSSAKILCAHLELAGFDFYKGTKAEHGMSPKLFSRFDRVWTGHYHTQSEQDNVKYLGAPFEFTWSDWDDPKGFHIYDIAADKLQFIKNKFTLFEKIIYNDSLEKYKAELSSYDFSVLKNKIVRIFVSRKTDKALYDWFIDEVYKQQYIDLSIVEDYSEITYALSDMTEANSGSYQTTKEFIDVFIEKLDTDLDKDTIKAMVADIYAEAIYEAEADSTTETT